MDPFLVQLQVMYEFSMAIGTSLDLKIMLRKSISTILRKLNCQAGGVLFLNDHPDGQNCFEQVFSIPRETIRIKEYQKALESIPDTFDEKWLKKFMAQLPLHMCIEPEKHIYLFGLPNVGILILLKNERALNPILVKSFAPLCAKLATACQACAQNEEIVHHRDHLETLAETKTAELVAQNFQLVEQIKERKLAEVELRESEERYAAVVNQAIEGIYLVDPETKRVLESNESFQKMLGYEPEELHVLQVYDFVMHSKTEVDTIMSRVPSWNEIFIGERKYRNRSGGIIDFEVSAKLINFSGKKAILVIVRDTSDKKLAAQENEKLKERLRQAQKFEALGTLAGGVAHDLNNVLSGVVGYPELLLNKLPSDSELRAPLTAIHDSGKRAATIVADLLTIARGAASNRNVNDLNSLISEYFVSPEFKNVASEYPGVSYKQRLTTDLSSILCSPVHVKKCLMNLVINATEAIHGSGEITISTSNQLIDDSDPNYTDFDKGMYVVMDVCDTGLGISDKDLEHIFDPFYTKKELGRSGTGLGLTVVWNTVLDHNGKIKIESSQNGSCFKLFFPHCNENKTPQPNEAPKNKTTSKKERVLIVDDEPALRDIASQMLDNLGYIVQSVPSGEEAIYFIKKNPVDLLVLDMQMDPGMNGRQTYEKIKEIQPDIKAVIASGFSESSEVKEALHLGANGFIQKPYSMNQLGGAIKDALEQDLNMLIE